MIESKRRPGRPRGGKNDPNPAVRNVTLDRAEADSLNLIQDRLEAQLGFRPNLSQTVRWLINHASKLMDSEDDARARIVQEMQS